MGFTRMDYGRFRFDDICVVHCGMVKALGDSNMRML